VARRARGHAFLSAADPPDPIGSAAQRDLRWYIEEYLKFPYGAEESRAVGIERGMDVWGEALFAQAFRAGERGSTADARACYKAAVSAGLERCDLCVGSDDGAFLRLPWELLRDPSPGREFLVPALNSLYRRTVGHTPAALVAPAAGGPFRILLVIARPRGVRDVPLGTVARPMLEALRPLRPHLQVCRWTCCVAPHSMLSAARSKAGPASTSWCISTTMGRLRTRATSSSRGRMVARTVSAAPNWAGP